jgi:hypothetical protein
MVTLNIFCSVYAQKIKWVFIVGAAPNLALYNIERDMKMVVRG